MKIIKNEDTDGREEYDSAESLLAELEGNATKCQISSVKYFLRHKCTTFHIITGTGYEPARDRYDVEYD